MKAELPKMKPILLSLTVDQHTAIKAAADAVGLSVTAYIRNLAIVNQKETA